MIEEEKKMRIAVSQRLTDVHNQLNLLGLSATDNEY
jgi:hypothetical protein